MGSDLPARVTTATRGLRRLAPLAASALLLCACATLGLGRPEPLTVHQVVAMSRAGEPAAAIVERMRESGTVYRLSASQLAKLHDECVPDAVIDEMQRTYLASVRHHQELEDWGYWTGVDGYWYGGSPYGWPDDWIAIPRLAPGHIERDLAERGTQIEARGRTRMHRIEPGDEAHGSGG